MARPCARSRSRIRDLRHLRHSRVRDDRQPLIEKEAAMRLGARWWVAAWVLISIAWSTPASAQGAQPVKVDAGDTAFVLLCTALVMLMTPGLALFYGGMVRRKNALATIMQSFICLGLV